MTADEIISREIKEAVLHLRISARRKQLNADALAAAAAEEHANADRIEQCDKNGAHKFQTVSGSGMLGGRFEEKCSKCGWVHTS